MLLGRKPVAKVSRLTPLLVQLLLRPSMMTTERMIGAAPRGHILRVEDANARSVNPSGCGITTVDLNHLLGAYCVVRKNLTICHQHWICPAMRETDAIASSGSSNSISAYRVLRIDQNLTLRLRANASDVKSHRRKRKDRYL